jgi:hypothetical protein
MAREGSSGVEKTFRVLRTPASSQTQSVNVPPVSTATRISEFGERGMNMEDYHCAIQGSIRF